MRSLRAVTVCGVLLMLGAPMALAGWGMKGGMEPSTARDASDGYMWTTADTNATGGRHVYFNGFSGVDAYVATHLSPNAALVDSSVQPFPADVWAALGVWKDCNGDGYIGFGDQGLWEYRAELLTLPDAPGFSICPNQGDIDPRFPFVAPGWVPPHNDGRWVHEFIAIGWLDWRDTSDLNPWLFNDSGARIWADFGLPESRQPPTCSVTPAPAGTYQSTGAFFAYTDCVTGYKGTAAINDVAARNPLLSPLSFADQPNGKQGDSSSILNQKSPWGRQEDAAYVSAWDCEKSQVVVRDPTWSEGSGSQTTHVPIANPVPGGAKTIWVNLSNDQGEPGASVTSIGGVFVRVNASQPRAIPGTNPGGSAAGTVNDTQSSTGNCHRHDNTGPGLSHTPYALEGSGIVRGEKRVSSDFTLHYELGRSRQGPHTLTGRGAPPDYGVKLTGREACYNSGVLYQLYCYDGLWRDVTQTESTRLVSAPNPYVDRNTLGPREVTIVTYYATLGADATSKYGFKTPGASGSYGSEGCAQTPATFECDGTLWWPGNTVPRTAWLGPDPEEPTRSRPYGVRAGQTYQLRDVDCYDQGVGALRENGVTWGTVTATAC